MFSFSDGRKMIYDEEEWTRLNKFINHLYDLVCLVAFPFSPGRHSWAAWVFGLWLSPPCWELQAPGWLKGTGATGEAAWIRPACLTPPRRNRTPWWMSANTPFSASNTARPPAETARVDREVPTATQISITEKNVWKNNSRSHPTYLWILFKL